MPNYEYRCLDCRKRFEVSLSYKEYDHAVIHCPFCRGGHVQRRIGRVRLSRSTPDRLQSLADPSKLNSIDDDPQALGRMMRDMRAELGEEMPAEFDEVVDRLDHGQSPEQIDADMPGLSDNYPSGNDDSSSSDLDTGF